MLRGLKNNHFNAIILFMLECFLFRTGAVQNSNRSPGMAKCSNNHRPVNVEQCSRGVQAGRRAIVLDYAWRPDRAHMGCW
jgi:hypothetical protein